LKALLGLAENCYTLKKIRFNKIDKRGVKAFRHFTNEHYEIGIYLSHANIGMRSCPASANALLAFTCLAGRLV
jgi:hypothetical protein